MSITTPQGRFYEIDGKQLPSVTTILGILQKPALVPWAAKMTAEYCQQFIYDNGKHDIYNGTVTLASEEIEAMISESKKAHRQKAASAMAHGTRVHEAIAFWIESDGTADRTEVASFITDTQKATAEECDAALMGFDAFLAWGDSVDLEIINSEQVVTDGEYYAGRYDLLARVNGTLTLIDIKTSTGIWDEYWLQCAGYAFALEALPDAIGVLRIDKQDGSIEYQNKVGYHYEGEAFSHLAVAFHHLQKCKPEKKGKKNGNNN